MANTFYGVARNSVTLILNAPEDKQVAIAKACFPGIKQEHIDVLLKTPHKITFSEDGNEIIFPEN